MTNQQVAQRIYNFLKSKIPNIRDLAFQFAEELNKSLIFIAQQAEKRYYGDINQYSFSLIYWDTINNHQEQINIYEDIIKNLCSNEFKNLTFDNYKIYNISINGAWTPKPSDVFLQLDGFGDTYQAYNLKLEIHLKEIKENETK